MSDKQYTVIYWKGKHISFTKDFYTLSDSKEYFNESVEAFKNIHARNVSVQLYDMDSGEVIFDWSSETSS